VNLEQKKASGGRRDLEATSLTEDSRERLEDIRDALLAGKVSEAKEMMPAVEVAHRKCRAAYLALGEPAETAGR
jgi:hypothetical protein